MPEVQQRYPGSETLAAAMSAAGGVVYHVTYHVITKSESYTLCTEQHGPCCPCYTTHQVLGSKKNLRTNICPFMASKDHVDWSI